MKTFAILDDATPGYTKPNKKHKVTIVVSDPQRNLYNRVYAENVLLTDAEPLVELLNLHHDIGEIFRVAHEGMHMDVETVREDVTNDGPETHPWDIVTQYGDDGMTQEYKVVPTQDGEFREIRGLFEFRSFKESPRQGFPVFIGEQEAAKGMRKNPDRLEDAVRNALQTTAVDRFRARALLSEIKPWFAENEAISDTQLEQAMFRVGFNSEERKTVFYALGWD